MRINEYGIVSAMESMPVGVAAAAPAAPTDALAVWRDHAQVKAAQASAQTILAAPVDVPGDDSALVRLAAMIADAKAAIKNADDARLRVVEPLKKAAGAVDAAAREMTAPLKAWITGADRAFVLGVAAQEERRRRVVAEEEAKLLAAVKEQAKAADAGDQQEVERLAVTVARAQFAADQPVASKGVKLPGATLSIRKWWTVEVIDAAQVPPRFLVPDMSALQRAVDAGERQIPGCNVYEAAGTQSRGRR